MRALAVCVVAVSLALGAAGRSASEEAEDGDADAGSGPAASDERPQPAGPQVTYTVELTGVENDDLKALMERSMLLKTLQDEPPATLPGLARRVEGDTNRLEVVLRSEGFWDGTVEGTVDTSVSPLKVTMSVEQGAQYEFGSYQVRFVGDEPAPDVPTQEELGVAAGAPARGEEIVAAGRKLFKGLFDDARPLAERVDRVITVDHRDQTVNVEMVVDPGPPARFGPIEISGLDRTDEAYVRQWITWEQGAPYDQSKVDEFRSGLLGSGLFGSVVVRPAKKIDADGELPIAVEVSEAKPRSVGVGVNFSTDRGVGGRVFWRHRNLFGRDEDFEVSLRGDFLEQEVKVDLERPNFGALDRTLFFAADAKRSDTDAFKGFEANAGGGISWPLAERWQASIGGAINYSNLDDVEGQQSSLLFGIPMTVSYDGQDNDLHPTEGVRFNLVNTPYVGEGATTLLFNAATATVSAYYALDEERRFILAGRTRLGSIVGAETLDLPANKRFYAGGGGSIRGYAFQSVGPLAPDNDPIGGRSLIEFSAEMRLRVWGDIGVVPFVDAGNVYDQSFPSFDDPLQWGAGLGLRYHTAAGPLRFDVAFPVNRREGVDDPFQIYISLGQAF